MDSDFSKRGALKADDVLNRKMFYLYEEPKNLYEKQNLESYFSIQKVFSLKDL
jgi:hypothetical protein